MTVLLEGILIFIIASLEVELLPKILCYFVTEKLLNLTSVVKNFP